jgi:DNA-binding transcriptional MocR family regulator
VVDDPVSISLAYLTPTDAQPQVETLLRQAITHDWWVLWDISQTEETTFHPALNPAITPRVATVGSFSAWMPGWRVGWMAGSEKVEKLRAYKQSMTICSTSVAQWAALGLRRRDVMLRNPNIPDAIALSQWMARNSAMHDGAIRHTAGRDRVGPRRS